MLKLQVIGRLGNDAEVREVGTSSVISFSVAHSEKYTDRQSGQPVEKTTWLRCSYWRQPDRVGVAQYLKKGTQVYVEGTPTANAFINRDGQNAASLECRVFSLELLGSRADNATAGAAMQQQSSGTSVQEPGADIKADNTNPVDDLPF